MLVPGSGDYLTNPASLAYRGPDRLFVLLADYPPTLAVAVVGVLSIALGLRSSIRHRRVDGAVILATWVLVVLGGLAASALSGAATDYPPLRRPSCSPRSSSRQVPDPRASHCSSLDGSAAFSRESGRDAWLVIALVAAIVVAGPTAVNRFWRQASVYQPINAAALTAAAAWIDEELAGDDLAVLANVRESKWIEGITGRTTLFAQPVRYAFRPIEWQRSVDANAILRSTKWAHQRPLVGVVPPSRRGADDAVVPTGLTLSVNHGGELVGVLQEVRSFTGSVTADGSLISIHRLAPASTTSRETERQASITTRRLDRDGGSGVELASTVRPWADGSTMQLVTSSSGTPASRGVPHPFGNGRVLRQRGGAGGTHLLHADRRVSAVPEDPVPDTGRSPPRIMSAGRIVVTTTTSHRAIVHITALTAGAASVGSGSSIRPRSSTPWRRGRAAPRGRPRVPSRVARLAALGFQPGPTSGRTRPRASRTRMRPGRPSQSPDAGGRWLWLRERR